MAFFDNITDQEVTPETSQAVTGYGEWLDVGTGAVCALVLTVTNLSGTSPTLDWSVEDTANPADSAEVITEKFAAAAFTQITGAPFPNRQTAYLGIPERNNTSVVTKRYVRAKWTLTGTSPIATVKVAVEKI